MRRLTTTGVAVAAAALSAAITACGGASSGRPAAAASCAALMLAIGEASDVDATRRAADIEAVADVCRRYAAGRGGEQ